MADQRGQRSNIGVARSEATVLESLEHKPEVLSEPSGEDLTELPLERFHRKVGVTNLLVHNDYRGKCPQTKNPRDDSRGFIKHAPKW